MLVPIPADAGEIPVELPELPDEGDGGLVDVEPEVSNATIHAAGPLMGHPLARHHELHVDYPGYAIGRHRRNPRQTTLAVQRALLRAGSRHVPASGRYGHRTVENVKHFQKQHRLHQDGVVGRDTWRALDHTRGHRRLSWFDGYGAWLVRTARRPPPPPPDDERGRIVKAAMYGYEQRGLIHYLQQRPMIEMVCPPRLDSYADCSEFATLCYKCAGAPDPTGFGYDGYGNTDSMLAHGRRVDLPGRGDLILYSNPGHVVVCVSWPYGVSHGSEGGPYYLRADYRPITAFRSYV